MNLRIVSLPNDGISRYLSGHYLSEFIINTTNILTVDSFLQVSLRLLIQAFVEGG